MLLGLEIKMVQNKFNSTEIRLSTLNNDFILIFPFMNNTLYFISLFAQFTTVNYLSKGKISYNITRKSLIKRLDKRKKK